MSPSHVRQLFHIHKQLRAFAEQGTPSSLMAVRKLGAATPLLLLLLIAITLFSISAFVGDSELEADNIRTTELDDLTGYQVCH